MIRAQQAPTHRQPSKGVFGPAMTAFASNILAALPGVGAKIGAGQGMAMGEGAATDGAGFEAVFAALLANSGQMLDGAKAGLPGAKADTVTTDGKSEGDVASPDALLAEALLLAPQMLAAQATAPSPDCEAAATAKGDVAQAPAATAAPFVAMDASAVVPASEPDAAAMRVAPPQTAETLAAEAGAVDTAVVAQPSAAAVQAPAIDAPATPVSTAHPPSPESAASASRAETPLVQGRRPADVVARTSVPAAPAPTGTPVETARPEATATTTTNSTAPAAGAPADVARVLSSAPIVSAVASVQPAAKAERTEREAAVAAPTAEAAALEAEDIAIAPDVVAEVAVQADAAPETVAQPSATDTPAKAAAPSEPKRVGGAFDTRTLAEAVEPEALREVKGEPKSGEARPQVADIVSRALAPDVDAVAAPQAAAPAPGGDTPLPEPTAATPLAAAAHHAEAPAEVRGAPETVAKLASDIVRKLDGKTTRFDLQLDPLGLGKVDVTVEIGADGRLTAALGFDSAQAANELRGRSAELRQALQQAGFEVTDSSLSFDLSSQGGGFGGRDAGGRDSQAWSSRAFRDTQAGLDEADARIAASAYSRTPTGGVDIRI